MTFDPTAEQRDALTHFLAGGSFGIEAGAGTGKTSTLILLAEADPFRRGQYVAFNKSIVTEASTKMPANVACNTAHSLAFRSAGRPFQHRLRGRRMTSNELARRLDVDPIWINVTPAVRKVLQPGYLASLVMRSIVRFCQTADLEPGPQHVPYIDGIDLPRDDGTRTFANNRLVSSTIAPALIAAWKDVSDPAGELPYRHDHYLKRWQLNEPKIDAEFILFDEAQDANPVMLDAVRQQDHAQLIFVGDSCQQIYEFTGAINALGNLPADDRTYLTQSFRFGPPIAALANDVLDRIGAVLRLRGTPSLPALIGKIEKPDAILTRTNATAVRHVLSYQRDGHPVHLIGGGTDVLSFARAAADLRASGFTSHPELACFTSWGEVRDYVAQDPQGGDLRLLVDLVEEFGTDVIEEALGRITPEGPGVVVVSTAHKAKGREWDRVKLATDFAPDEERDVADGDGRPLARAISVGELRLLYVALTRARRELDVTAVPTLNGDGADGARKEART